MRKVVGLVFLLAFSLAPLEAAGQEAPSPSAPDSTSASASQDSTVVAVYGDQAVTLEEFERRYARSVGGPEAAAQDSIEAYRDFLNRYINFRLKVQAAQAAGMGADSAMQQEIAQYRAGLARPYLLEQEVLDPLIRNLYERKQQMVDASHILIRLEPNATPEDTLAAYNRMAALVDSVEAGMDFGEVAARYSEDPSAQRPSGPGSRGRLGYFTAGRMIAPFEDAAYATPVGALSPIIRTRFGYHVLRVHDRREAVAPIRVSHILIRPAASTPAAADSARALADSLRSEIEAGADFAELARRYSADPGSASQGGDLGMVPYDAPLVPPFKEAAFALENAGDVSEVVETQYGYHLIKLTEQSTFPAYDEAYDELKQEVAKLPRTREAEAAFAQEALRQRGATVDTTAALRPFEDVPVDSLFFTLVGGALPEETMAQPVATLGDSTFTLGDVAAFAVRAQVPRKETTREQVLALLDVFLAEQALDYEAAALEERDEEFRIVMEEFRDGLLLFKLMEDSVWTAAGRDTAALEAYFEAHADAYQYDDRTRVISLYSPSDSLLEATVARLEGGLSLAALAEEVQADSLAQLRIDTTMVAGETGSVYDAALALETGERTEPIAYQGGSVVLVRDAEEPARPMRFEEAINRVIADYQEVLEARLLERLRARYDAETFPERLNQAFDGVTASAGASTEASTATPDQ